MLKKNWFLAPWGVKFDLIQLFISHRAENFIYIHIQTNTIKTTYRFVTPHWMDPSFSLFCVFTCRYSACESLKRVTSAWIVQEKCWNCMETTRPGKPPAQAHTFPAGGSLGFFLRLQLVGWSLWPCCLYCPAVMDT